MKQKGCLCKWLKSKNVNSLRITGLEILSEILIPYLISQYMEDGFVFL